MTSLNEEIFVGATYVDSFGGKVSVSAYNDSLVKLDIVEGFTGYYTYPINDFIKEFTYVEGGKHNHENVCCTVHHIHTMPHRGCILR